MSAPRFLDTNVLIYSIDSGEPEKRDRALAILAMDECTLSVQVLQEFYVQATRASRAQPLSHEHAAGLIDAWTRFQIQENTLAVMTSALQIKAAHGFSFWDCAIIAAARALGCSELLTENLVHGLEIGGVRIVNPFR